MGVVDGLEVVHVEHHEREAPVASPGSLQLAGELLVEATMVGEPGQRVGPREPLELRLVAPDHRQQRRGPDESGTAEDQEGHAVHAPCRESDDADPEHAEADRRREQQPAREATALPSLRI